MPFRNPVAIQRARLIQLSLNPENGFTLPSPSTPLLLAVPILPTAKRNAWIQPPRASHPCRPRSDNITRLPAQCSRKCKNSRGWMVWRNHVQFCCSSGMKKKNWKVERVGERRVGKECELLHPRCIWRGPIRDASGFFFFFYLIGSVCISFLDFCFY